MTSPWQMLAGNLAVVALFVLGWGHARYWLRGMPGVVRSALFGLAMGAGAIGSMLMSVQIDPGLYIDLRLSLFAVSAFLGGPLAALITAALAMAWRVEMGGWGVAPALAIMTLATGIGLGLRAVVSRRGTTPTQILVLGLLVAGLIVTVVGMIPPRHMVTTFIHTILPTALLNLVATVIAGLVVLQARRLSAERDLLLAAMNQAPDYTYVKDRFSRFAVVNQAVARLYGFPAPQDMVGKTDFELVSPERAKALYETEQKIVESGEPLIGFEEHLPDNLGRHRWYTTSKVPLHSASGDMIGIAGVTRDITDDKQMREDLLDSRHTLSYALAEMSDGLAMFDGTGRIEFCNEQYRQCFPFTGAMRRPGAHMRDILRAVIDSGEQITAPIEDAEQWIEHIVENLRHESEEEVNLFNGRWLQVRTRPTSESKTLVVVTDVTRIKQAELALHSATDQLKQMVRTDSLTGLFNRRAFDEAMDIEIARSSRGATPMSLLLVDVDRFKLYNDEYGHPAGDDCLRVVAQHLQKSLRRPADLAVRYGGEEFAAILPETDEDGAYLVAEAFRKSLVEARMPHRGSERSILTASVGVATYMPDNLNRSVAEIIQVADEALYSAKAAGRDRVYGRRVMAHRARYAHE